MNPAQLAAAIRGAVLAAVDGGALALPVAQVPDEITVDRPRNRDHGDYATPVALQLARAAGQPPRAIADALAPFVRQIPGLAAVDVAGPGFLNLMLAPASAAALVGEIVRAGDAVGGAATLVDRRINLEFVSANPTGPLLVSHSRWAAVGDALGRVLKSQGAQVTREYYFNDAGVQIDRFARSLLAQARGRAVPEDGYAGDYIEQIAGAVTAEHPQAAALPDEQALAVYRTAGVQLMFDEIKASLHRFRTDFDVYFHEDSLHSSGAVAAVVDKLKQSGRLYFADGAWWLRSTDYGDDKDRVVIKSDGEPAYIAADIAYFADKRARGFTDCVYMLGADHHGYVARLKAAAAALDDDPDTVEVLIGQLVNLVRNGVPVRMGKRSGNLVTMDDLVAALGVDAARYALIRYSIDSNIDIDLDLWARQTNDNPVFYVQYAHARLCSLRRAAAELGIELGEDYDGSRLDSPQEGELIAQLAAFPGVLAAAAELREPHRVARYLEDLAGAYHKFYDARRVLPMGDEPVTDVTIARLWLCEAARIVLAKGLSLLGVAAPERM